MRDLYIVGAGAHGREILDVVQAINAVEPTWSFPGFVADDMGDRSVLDRRGAAVVCSIDEFATSSADFVIAVGDAEARRRIDRRLRHSGDSPALIHPSARIHHTATLDAGVLVPAGCHIGASVHIGRHATLNANVSVGSGCRLGSYATLSPGAVLEADAVLGDAAFLGVRARVRTAVSVGADARVGAGAVVHEAVAPHATVVGSPARPVAS